MYEENLSQFWFEVAAEWECVSDDFVGAMSNRDGDMRGPLAQLESFRDTILGAPRGDLRQQSLQTVDELVEWVTDFFHPRG